MYLLIKHDAWVMIVRLETPLRARVTPAQSMPLTTTSPDLEAIAAPPTPESLRGHLPGDPVEADQDEQWPAIEGPSGRRRSGLHGHAETRCSATDGTTAVVHRERSVHRPSIAGEELGYVAVVAREQRDAVLAG